MARFIAGINGDAVSRLGHKANGVKAHVRGWVCGVEVEAEAEGEADAFHVIATPGSQGAGGRVHVGTIRRTDAGYTWEPGDKIAKHKPAARGG
jgi:hypothetical protein